MLRCKLSSCHIIDLIKLTCSSKVQVGQGSSNATSRSMSRGALSGSETRSAFLGCSFKLSDSRLLLKDFSLLSSIICGVIPIEGKIGAIFLFAGRKYQQSGLGISEGEW